MKKMILSIAACLLCSVAAQAQFVLTPQGFFNSEDQSKDYYVMECPGLSQTELFMKAEVFLALKYEVSRDIGRESMLISGVAPQAVVNKAGSIFAAHYDLLFSMTLNFKDNRIRVMYPVVNSIKAQSSGTRSETQVSKIKNNDGEVIGSEEREVKVPYYNEFHLYISPYYIAGGEYPLSNASFIYDGKNDLRLPVAKESLEVYFNNLIISLHRYIMSPYEEW